jgi:ubiquinone/menaquinone biosynthesis C-methylase UbiE
MNIQTSVNPDFTAIKARQQMAWSSGDYAVVGTTLQIVGEMLCEAVDLRSTDRVLDVAAGNGNATLAAARRFADVISTDYVGSLLDRGRARAQAERLHAGFQEADVEALPFEDSSFDVVLSTFGVMFAPDHGKAAKEMLRVCRVGGKLGMANWTPDGFIGRLFKIIGKYVPPVPGMQSPALWGSHTHLEALFGPRVAIAAEKKMFNFRYRSPEHWVQIFRTYYGPVLKTFQALDPEQRGSFERDIHALLQELNVAKDGTLVVPGEYLEVVITRKR